MPGGTHLEDAFDNLGPPGPSLALEREAGASTFLQPHHPGEGSMLGRDPCGIHERGPHLSPCPPINLCEALRLLPAGDFPGPSSSRTTEEHPPIKGVSL